MTSVESEPTVRTVSVEFSGERGGTFPATFAQANVLDWVTWEGSGAVFDLYADLPAGCAIGPFGDAVSTLVARHEVLRTTFADGRDGRTQIVAENGTFDIGIVELGSAARSTPRLSSSVRPFDHCTEYPMRLVVATDRGTPVRVLFEFSHVGLDLIAATVVRRELMAIVRATASETERPQTDRISSPDWQPVDQAGFERTPEGVESHARTLRYWREKLQRVPQCLLAKPAHQTVVDYRMALLRSGSAAAALSQIAQRARVSPATVIMSTVAALLAWWTDNDEVAVYAACSNRSQPHMNDYVGTIAQEALVPYTPVPSSFYATLRKLHIAAMSGYRHASFDGAAIAQIVEAVSSERRRSRHRDFVVNDMSAVVWGECAATDDGGGQAGQPLDMQIETGMPTATSDPIRLIIRQASPVLVLNVTHDRRYVSDQEAADLLAAVHRTLIHAAEYDLDLSDLGKVSGVDRVGRPDSWVKLSSGWADLAISERLFQEVTDDKEARLVIDQPSAGGPVLVGHAAPTDPRCGHAELHAKGMARLGDAHGLVLPDSYVLSTARR